jgi:hypothetical protein
MVYAFWIDRRPVYSVLIVISSILSAYSCQCARIQIRQRPRNWTYLPYDQTGPPLPQDSCDCRLTTY